MLANIMKKTVLTYFIAIFLISCNSKKNSDENSKGIQIDSTKSSIEMADTISQERFIDFPIPELDSIFPYFETSGAVANSPSKRFYNPTDSGIFVFYTLFDKKKLRDSKYSFDEMNIGTLTTHTFRKPKYGWSETDKDQTFILLQLDGKPIKIGESIEVGMLVENLERELGKPVYQVDSTIVYLGKNKIIGRFNIDKGKVESITYGRFNLNDSIFELERIIQREIIEEKLKGIKEEIEI